MGELLLFFSSLIVADFLSGCSDSSADSGEHAGSEVQWVEKIGWRQRIGEAISILFQGTPRQDPLSVQMVLEGFSISSPMHDALLKLEEDVSGEDISSLDRQELIRRAEAHRGDSLQMIQWALRVHGVIHEWLDPYQR